jgi:hypothetical protein
MGWPDQVNQETDRRKEKKTKQIKKDEKHKNLQIF